MSRFRAFLFRVRGLFRRKALESDSSDELRSHLDELTERNLAAGLSPDEARYAARRAFGGVTQIAERSRSERRAMWFEHFARDIRHGLRALRKTPAFTLTAVLTLALGIGVNTALFLVYNAVALRALPVRDPESLVRIFGEEARGGTFVPNFSFPEYLDYRDANRVLSDLAAVSEAQAVLGDLAASAPDPMLGGRDVGTVSVQYVSENYFNLLGAGLRLGRAFLSEENRAPGAAAVAVLSHLFWRNHFRGDPDVLGKTVSIGGTVYTVVGVAAMDFTGHNPAPPAMWLPLMMWAKAANYESRDITVLRLIGRLHPGVTEAQAKADLDLIAARLARLHPRAGGKNSVRLERGMKLAQIPLNALTLAVVAPLVLGFGLVLAIACTNVANLMLARGVARQQEIAVRLALGASRGRIVRQLLVENGLLCATATMVGAVLAWWSLQVLLPLLVADLPADMRSSVRVFQFLALGPDFRVVAFGGLMAGIAVLGAGLMPALHTSRGDLVSAIKNESSAFGRRLGDSRLRKFLIVVQVAVCLTLLSCAGLLLRNMLQLRALNVGYNPDTLFQVSEKRTGPAPAPHVARRELAGTLRAMPAVASACQLFGPIVGTGSFMAPVKSAGAEDSATLAVNYVFVSPEFPDTFAIPLLRGRTFTWPEVDAGARVVVVSEGLARRLWPGEDALGRTLAVGDAAFAFPNRSRDSVYREYTVVGIVRDIRRGIGDTAPGIVCLPLTAEFGGRSQIFIRPRTDSSAGLREIARVAEAQGRALQFRRLLSDALEVQKLPFRWLAALSGALGGLALLMAVTGLYGVMAFAVAQRTREIGIRMALGATAGNVVRLFVRQGMALVATGMLFGLMGGALFALLLRRIMFGLGSAFDPIAFAAVTLLLGGVAFIACWLPSRRAAKADPMVALRAE